MKELYPQRVMLKSGLPVTLRPFQATDESEFVRFFSSLPPEHVEFHKDNLRDPKVAKSFARHRAQDGVQTMLAFSEDGRIVGNAMLDMDHFGWRRHVGTVHVVVSPEYLRQRLAKTLVRELLSYASTRGLKKLEVQILDSQLGAEIAFKNLGFHEEARLRGHAMDLHGKRHDIIILTIDVYDPWQRMEDLLFDLDCAREF
jgi:L-amino acid N-acyltransferase YncA